MADQSNVYTRNIQYNGLTSTNYNDIQPVKNFVWEEKAKSIKDLTTLCRPPFTARVHKGDISQFSSSWTPDIKNGDILQVLEIRRRKVVVIRKMQWERRTSEYVTGGKQIDVPATYKGWFEVIPEDGRPVEYFDTIQAITAVKPRRFLVRTSVVGYELRVENGTSCWMPREINPGDVLTTGIVYMDQKKTKSNVKTFFRKILKSNKNMKKEQDLKYLQCFDVNNKEIMVPLIMSGVFSPVGDTTEGNVDAVYEMQDMILAFNLPLTAQLVFEGEGEKSNRIPNGLIKIEEVRDEELAVVGRFPVSDDSQTFEIPLEADVILQRDISKKRKPILSQRKSSTADSGDQEELYVNTGKQASDVELPIRVKENRKGKSGILEKLSVRSKNRRERASLKALQEEGVFSSRLSKSDMNLDEFFRSEIEKEDTEENDTKNKREPENSVKTEGSHNVSNNSNISRFTLMNHSHSVSSYFDEDRQLFTPELGSESTYVQRRGLPPIPNNGSKQSSPLNEREAVYEELPVAPRPPDKIDDYPYTPARKHDDEDGYMSPAQLRLLQMQEYSETSSVVKNKPPVAPRDRLTRSRRPKSEISSNFADYGEFKDNIPINIDELFNFSEERYPKPDTQYASVLKSPYRMNTQTQFDRSYATEQNRFVDDQGLDTRPLNSLGKLKSRSHKNLNVAANVTVRSHNIRKMPNVMDVFTVNDSVRQPPKNDDSEYGFVQSPKYDQRSDFMENERGRMYPYGGFPPRGGYAESEPGLRRHSRSLSLAGINDPYAKQGDDSVLSGDYGYHGDSEYSYNEYSEWRDDGWTPPSDLSNLTVQEVSKSLRYIGMKDRVVIRLANEQIDGALLCSLDKKLLQEGFPELNALEVKKIVDFINGWRPKK